MLRRWYVSRTFLGDKHVETCEAKETKDQKLVLCEMTMQRAGTGETMLGNKDEFELYDIERTCVATCRLDCSVDDKKTPITKPLKQAEDRGTAWLAIVQKVHDKHGSFRQTNVTEIRRHTFGKVVTPYGTMPMWAYSAMAAQRAKRAESTYAPTLASQFYNACYFTHLRPQDFERASLDQQLEVICEMQTMATRFLVYTLDSSLRLGGDHLVDDWTRICDAPEPALIEYDCEDGAEEAISQSHALKWAKLDSVDGPLALAQKLEHGYYTCLGVVTLRLGSTDRWVYHALVLKFDERWLRARLGLRVFESDLPPLPPLLLELTAYTTSNWRFKTPACTAAMYEMASDLIDANSKISSELVIEQSLYGHLVSLTCPELSVRYGIAQIECAYKGRHGIPVKTLMLEPDREFEFVACRTEFSISEASQLLPATPMMQVQQAFRCSTIPTRPDYNRFPRTQFVIRAVDWNNTAIRQKLMARLAKLGPNIKFRFDPISVYGGIGGVNVVIEG